MLNVIYAESVIILNVIMLTVMVTLHKCHLPVQRKKYFWGEWHFVYKHIIERHFVYRHFICKHFDYNHQCDNLLLLSISCFIGATTFSIIYLIGRLSITSIQHIDPQNASVILSSYAECH
jgi:hypothetical protein